jgi:hypothetical protein
MHPDLQEFIKAEWKCREDQFLATTGLYVSRLHVKQMHTPKMHPVSYEKTKP